jgi:1,4-dihydroxy-2-naphthoate octaprenyltransferase
MLGTTFICSGNIIPEILWLAVPVGSITVAILHANNSRDIETDNRAGIKTFAMLTGRPAAINIYVFELLLPYCWLLLTVILGYVNPWTLTAFVTLPLALGNCKQMLSFQKKGIEAIANLDEATAKLQLAFSLTLAIGIIINALV